jgi:hypothetical protein
VPAADATELPFLPLERDLSHHVVAVRVKRVPALPVALDGQALALAVDEVDAVLADFTSARTR